MLGALARHIAPAGASMATGKWDRKLFSGTEVSGKTLGVLGMGRIGSEVAKRALAFGMRVLAYDRSSPRRARSNSVWSWYRTWMGLIAARISSPCICGDGADARMLNADAFARMKPGVRIVNCARGEIIEEKDLMPRSNRRRSRAHAGCVLGGAVAGGTSLTQAAETSC